ncbi:MAG: FG-GAP-like repeat-containing protein [Oculatellaceae cyanobacterium Prado106]|nr:FG-GAP-like repeat-containing protein [Oculatellaceae cyanobacterium Prado106]
MSTEISNPSSLKFNAAAELPLGGKSFASVLGDFDGDGDLDLVVPLRNALSKNLAVFLGNGQGSFAETTLAESGGSSAFDIVSADFNGDGKLDVAIAQRDTDEVAVLLGNGNGTFGLPTLLKVGDQPRSLAVGDFNKDGRPDLVTATTGETEVSVLMNQGNGQFRSADRVTVDEKTQPYSVAVGDLDGDGNLDLITANFYADSITVLLGKGNGEFRSGKSYTVGNIGTAPTGIALGDFNQDRKLDVAVSNLSATGRNAALLLGDGKGAFESRLDLSVGGKALSIQAADWNGDGKLDLITPDFSTGTTTVLLGDGQGLFPSFVQTTVGVEPSDLAIGDVDQDRKLDFVAMNSGGTNAAVVLNRTNLVLLKTTSDNSNMVDGSKETRSPLEVNLDQGTLKIKSSPQVNGRIKDANSFTTVLGTAGNDRIIGNSKRNLLNGNDGKDRITGLGGDDVISGGRGKDILSGGEGRDRFVFDTGRSFQESDGRDKILDFNRRQDRIVLDRQTFTALGSTVSFAAVQNFAAAESSAALVVYVRSQGRLFYNENGAAGGLGNGGLIALLKGGNLNLGAANFLTQT